MNKNILIALAAVSLILLITTAFFFQKAGNLNVKLAGAVQNVEAANKEILRLGEEKKKIAEENNKLQADTVSYVGINTKLQGEKESLEKKLQDAQKKIDAKEGDLEREKSRLEDIEKKIADNRKAEQTRAEAENIKLKKRISSLSSAVRKERGLYHYNLAVAYTQSQLFDDAVEAYEKSLQYDPDNADAHYNLGLLYQNAKQDPDKAMEHYNKYLQLKPDAADTDEVKALIDRLK